MTDARFPDRIGIGDGPSIPCRVVAMDITRDPGTPIISGTRLPDGTFRFDRPGGATQATLDQVQAWLASMTPAFQAFHEQMRRTFEALVVSLRPLIEFVEQHPELRDMQPETPVQACHHLCGRWPEHECTGDATGTLAYRPGGREVPMCDACRQATLAQDPRPVRPRAQAGPIPACDLDWEAQSAVCCHVCGPDPGHCCDARATTSITHPLPPGGTHTLPLCAPCHQAETAADSGAY